MTRDEIIKKHGLTDAQYRQHSMSFLQSEGYDDAGNEYETLDAWISRKKSWFAPVDTLD